MPDEQSFFAHETATIDDPSVIGAGTRIWHYSHVMPGARVGGDCIIGQNVYIDNNTVVGDGCKIQNNVSLYNGVVLEEGVFCGPSMVFTNVINPRAFIERDGGVRSHARRLRPHRRRCRGDQGRGAIRPDLRRAGAADRVDVPLRRRAAGGAGLSRVRVGLRAGAGPAAAGLTYPVRLVGLNRAVREGPAPCGRGRRGASRGVG